MLPRYPDLVDKSFFFSCIKRGYFSRTSIPPILSAIKIIPCDFIQIIRVDGKFNRFAARIVTLAVNKNLSGSGVNVIGVGNGVIHVFLQRSAVQRDCCDCRLYFDFAVSERILAQRCIRICYGGLGDHEFFRMSPFKSGFQSDENFTRTHILIIGVGNIIVRVCNRYALAIRQGRCYCGNLRLDIRACVFVCIFLQADFHVHNRAGCDFKRALPASCHVPGFRFCFNRRCADIGIVLIGDAIIR